MVGVVVLIGLSYSNTFFSWFSNAQELQMAEEEKKGRIKVYLYVVYPKKFSSTALKKNYMPWTCRRCNPDIDQMRGAVQIM
jgi:hypothetical protein